MIKFLILDLDLTISTAHTRGIYKKEGINWNISDYITIDKKEKLINCLGKLKACGVKIYLCSRGELNACYWFLNDSELLEYFDGVFGAINTEEYPALDFLSNRDRYQLELNQATKNKNEQGWEFEKVRHILHISQIQGNRVEIASIYFFDDTIENIIEARKNGIRSYQVDGKNEMSLITIMKSDFLNIKCLKEEGESKQESADKMRDESADKMRDEFIDQTEKFQGSVSNAIRHFKKNSEKLKVKIFSKRLREWYANINPRTGEYTHEEFYPHPEFNKKYILNNQSDNLVNKDYKRLYLKYKKKYLKLKNSL